MEEYGTESMKLLWECFSYTHLHEYTERCECTAQQNVCKPTSVEPSMYSKTYSHKLIYIHIGINKFIYIYIHINIHPSLHTDVASCRVRGFPRNGLKQQRLYPKLFTFTAFRGSTTPFLIQLLGQTLRMFPHTKRSSLLPKPGLCQGPR